MTYMLKHIKCIERVTPPQIVNNIVLLLVCDYKSNAPYNYYVV